jgi:hypothetical protein
MRRLLVGVTIAAAALALALPAVANHTSPQDGNDTEGLLDLRTVSLGHERPLVWTFFTTARWRPRQINDRGYFVIELDTRGDQSIDYVVLLRSRRQEMLGTLHRVLADGTQAEIAKLQSDKFGGRSAWVALGLRRVLIGPRRTSFFWAASSLYTGTQCPTTCIDRAPDQGLVEELLEEPVPTPTPSPSPTPIPSPSPSPSPSPTPPPSP